MHFIQQVRAKASSYRPVVMSQREVTEVLSYMRGTNEVMYRLMNRPGLAVTSPLDRIATKSAGDADAA